MTTPAFCPPSPPEPPPLRPDISLARRLLRLGLAGVELEVQPGDTPDAPTRLRFRFTLPAATPESRVELVSDIRASKHDFIWLFPPRLRGGADKSPKSAGALLSPEARVVMDERLGAADERGLASHAGSPSWLIALGRAVEIATGEAERMDSANNQANHQPRTLPSSAS